MNKGKEIRIITFCPHCGNRAPQKLVYTQAYKGRWYSVESGEETRDKEIPPSTYFIAVCETCNEILVYHDAVEDYENEGIFNSSNLLWPESGLHKSVPKIVAECYSEAERIKNLAPNAFAVQIRKALEAICDDRGAKKGVLQYRLVELVSRGEIPKILADMSEVLRVLGNLGAHATEQGIKPILVGAINDFFRAVVEYVYVAPSKLEDFRSRLNNYKKIEMGSDSEEHLKYE